MFNERGPGRAERKAATGAAVLDAARAEFEAVGFERANLRAIAARAGVSAGTVLHHYGDKRELLHAALYGDLEATLRRALARAGAGPLERDLAALARAVFGYYRRRPALSRTLLKESLVADGAWAKRFTAQVSEVHAAIARLTAEAIARGELAAGTDAPLVGAAWLSFFYFALIGWAQGTPGDPVRLVDRLTRQHLAGLRPPSRTGARR